MLRIGLNVPRAGLAVVMVSGLCGCGPNDRLKTAPVKGTVTVDGIPLRTGRIIFTPESGRSATGVISEDGSYQLGTYDENDGAIIGRHKVAVQARPKLQGESGGAPLIPRYGPSLIPEAYGDQQTSGLEYEVTDGTNQIDIKLSSKGP